MKHIVVISGAGISAESGLKTFRDSNGLWEGHDVMEVATPLGFKKNPELVLEFYNQRRRQLLEVNPNLAHKTIADLEKIYKVSIITQNVDDLHERAGSSFVLHLHGELFKVRSTSKQEMLQSRTLLSEQTHKIMLNNGLGQICPLSVRNYSGMFNATKPSFSPKVYENITVH